MFWRMAFLDMPNSVAVLRLVRTFRHTTLSVTANSSVCFCLLVSVTPSPSFRKKIAISSNDYIHVHVS